jgi:TatD DNase family protein
MPAFDADREAVIERAREAGVGRLMNPGVDLPSSRRAVALAEAYSEIYAAVGFHPHDSAKLGLAEFSELRELAKHPKVKAIGEIGLDYYRNLSPPDAQKRAFREQLELAADLDLPVIVHCRDAHHEVLAILREWARAFPKARGVLHSYSGDRAQIKNAVDVGFWIGLTGPITYPKAEEMRAVAREAPLERIVIETDAPYLTPAPNRGKRNEPAYVRQVAEKLAEVRGETIEAVATQTSANAARLFDWS